MMNKQTMCVTVGLFVASVCGGFAGPKEDLDAAVATLKEAKNYGWTTKSQFGSNSDRVRESKGKTDQSGLIVMTSQFRDSEVVYAKKGEKGAIKREGAWRSIEEIRAEQESAGEGDRRRRGMSTARLERMRTPVAEIGSLLEGVEALEAAEGVISGKLKAETVQERMRFGRRGDDGPTVSGATGSVKFWVSDGVLSKYEVKMSASMTFRDQPRDISVTTTTEIVGVGETPVELDEAGSAKLGG